MHRIRHGGWLLIAALGCGGGSQDSPPADATTDTTTDAPVDSMTVDSGAAIDSGTEAPDPSDHGGTTGKPCTTSDDCDVAGDGVNQCSLDWFVSGSLYPTPVCFGTACAPPDDPTKLAPCDEGKGWCMQYTKSTRCYPKCSFEFDTDTTPTGCVGKDVCEWLGWSTDSKGVVHATGYCWAGCVEDADCPSGEVCQKELGECVFKSKYWTATKSIGDPCTASDRGTTTVKPTCSCWMNSTLGHGYCSSFCRVGDATCPTGFTCDAQLPADGSHPFTATAKGLAGACMKNCDTDAECLPLGGYCDERPGIGRKTCQFGVRSGDAGVDAGADVAADGAGD